MNGEGGAAPAQTSDIRKVGVASSIGAMVEWYDFHLYGYASAIVFAQLFFPEVDPVIGTLSAFGTFAVGFFARPVGAIVFGNYGDRVGRKSMLVITLMLMGVATAVIGMLPTYAAIGIWAPILLVAMRVLQGIGVGGEWGGAALMVVEHAPPRRRGFFGSWPQMGSAAGQLLALGLFTAVSFLPEEQFLSWGWRVPFLVSIVLVGIGIFIRLRIMETPAFRALQEEGGQSKTPIVDAVRQHPRSVLLVIGMRVAENAGGYIFAVFILAYGTEQLGLGSSTVLAAVAAAAAASFFVTPLWGALSDRIGRRPVYMIAPIFLILAAFPFFWLVDTGVAVLIGVALVVVRVFGIDPMFATQPAFFSELFGTRVRYSGVSLGYQISGALAGGLSPLIATALVAATGGTWAVALYLVVMATITLVSVYFATETFRGELFEGEGQALEAAAPGAARPRPA